MKKSTIKKRPRMEETGSAVLRDAIFEIIDRQIEGNNPPETKATYDRLIADGYSREETMKLIGCVVSSEIFGVLQQGRRFDEAAYIRQLRALPQLPWEEEKP